MRALAVAIGGVALLCLARSGVAQTRRALLVGINGYNYSGPLAERWRSQLDSNAAKSLSVMRQRRAMVDLTGAVSDARMMAQLLRERFQFTDTRVVEDSDATRAGILQAIRRLVDDAHSGDVVVFFFAGHGSEQKNSGAKPRYSINGMDQTIVPADANIGQFDIRNIELTKAFAPLLARNVQLTLIFDSCHSGSVVRGEALPGVYRYAPFDLRDAQDSSDAEPLMSPDRPNPALFLAAAQEDQLAEEASQRDPVDGEFHGVFTSALLQVLRDPATPPDEPAELLLRQVQAIMRWHGQTQVPALKGAERDRRRPLFGNASGPLSGRIVLALQGVHGDTAMLDGGLAVGLGAGSELRSVDSGQASIRLRISGMPTASTSRAIVSAGKLQAARPGMLFVVDKWVSPMAATMRMWIPAGVDGSAVATAIPRLQSLRSSTDIDWVDDPTVVPDDGRPLFIVDYQAPGWQLRTPMGRPRALQDLSSQTVLTAIAAYRTEARQHSSDSDTSSISIAGENGKPRLLVILPPTRELEHAVRSDLATSFPFRATSHVDSADYALFGRLSGDTLRYAWVLPNATVASQRRSPLPARTEWIVLPRGPRSATRTGQLLQDQGVLLSRVFYWLSVQPQDSGHFPYHLVLRDSTGRLQKQIGDTVPNYGGEVYSLVLRRDPADRAPISSRWVYVFTIDSHGEGKLMFGESQNRFPFADSLDRRSAPAEIPLPTEPDTICGPYGVDTFLMVASAEPLPAPTSIFNFEPVLRKAPTSDGRKLQATNWSIERFAIASMPPPPTSPRLVAAEKACDVR